MAEVTTGEFSKYRSSLIDAHGDMNWWLWDIGPEEPSLPEPPDPPEGKDGQPKYDLAKIQYKRKLKAYEAALEQYERDQIAYTKWARDVGGAIEIGMWSINAKEAIAHDVRAVAEHRQTKRRYYVSARTPGQSHLENAGLPSGMKPGRGQQANLERQAAGELEFSRVLRSDPVFGAP
jgi:hypothetical protein